MTVQPQPHSQIIKKSRLSLAFLSTVSDIIATVMQKRFSLLAIVVLLLVVLATSSATRVLAQGGQGEPLTGNTGAPAAGNTKGPSAGSASYDIAQMQEYYSAIRDCYNPSLECLVFNVSRYISIELSRTAMGEINPKSSGTTVPGLNTTTPVANVGNSFVSGISYGIGAMYGNPVANTQTYVADILNSAHISTPAYAQGIGFASLDPVLELWKTFRNVAYMFFVIIFIIIGFLIMFRAKISGQTAVTAQQAIPTIIVSLLFVTFSYAIAGFMIDLMYLSMFLILGIFSKTFSNNPNIVNYNIIELAGTLWGATVDFRQNIDVATNIIASLGANEVNSIVRGFGVAGGITMTLVLAVIVVIGTFKLFFELLKSYASIVVSVVTSPIILMMGAIPGKNPFWPWLWDLLGNLSAFPMVLMVVVLFYEFTEAANGIQGGFMPPFLIARGQPGAIASLMGLALIIALPEIVKETKKAVGAKDGLGTQILGWAKANTQEAWNGNKYVPGVGKVYGKVGRGAKNVAKFGAKAGLYAGATAGGAAAGAGVGGLWNMARGGTFGAGARRGALVGAAAPTGLKMAPGLIKDAWRIGKQEAGQQLAYQVVGSSLDKLRQSEGAAKQIADHEFSKRFLARLGLYNQALVNSGQRTEAGTTAQANTPRGTQATTNPGGGRL
ncbi:hypothetical protein KBC79_02615 [Candidatus Woesebacteria bacterium]|nr:hypothetical protein [Candidatus Woesebacteria bacterium]